MSIIRTVVIALALARAVPAFALEGVVVDRDTRQPIANAEVSILGLHGLARTDAGGRFVWKPEPVPPFEVLVVLPGGRYMKPVLIERLPADGVLAIEVTPLVEESVTVSANVAPSIESTPGSATTLLPAEVFQVRQPANLAQAIENVAGVSTESEGQVATPTVRGLSGGRTLVLIDGARVSSERRAGASVYYLDPFALDDVQVARGPGSVAYGSDAFGGVIYARTRRVEPGTPLQMRATGALGAGTDEARAGLEASKGTTSGGVLGQVYYRSFGDYRSPDGTVTNSGSESAGFMARGTHALGRGVLSASWQSDFGRDIGRPRNNSNVVRFFYPQDDSHRFTTSYDVNQVGTFNRLSVVGFLGDSRVVTEQDRYATSTTPRRVERADVSAQDYQARVFAEKLLGETRLEFGIDVNGRFGLEAIDEIEIYDQSGALVSTATNDSIENANRNDAAAYVMTEVALSRIVHFAGGIRGDYVTTANEGGYFGDLDTSNGALSGFVSVTAGTATGLSATAQVARGFRDPLLSDRYYRGPTGRGFITGNPDLEPETSIQFDGAVRYTAPRWRAAVYAYHYRIDDLIERYQTAPDTFYFRNRGQARVRGLEVEGQAELGRGFTFEVSGAIASGVALDDDTPLDDIAPPTLALQLRKQITPKAFAQVRGFFNATDDEPGPTERTAWAYATLEAAAGYRVTDRFELRVLGRNLFDTEYLASTDTRAVLAPGISVAVTALARF